MRPLLASALTLLACAEPTPEPEQIGPQAKFQQACEAYVAAWCARRDECAVGRDRALQGEACLQARLPRCRQAQSAALGRDFEDFDPVQAGRCNTAARSAECALFDEEMLAIADCKQAYGARAESGQACINSGDCSGGVCVRPLDGCGRCEALGAVGASCTEFPCVSGAVCVDSVCRPRRAEGHACAGDAGCGPGLFCHLERRVCEAQRGLGEPCADDRDIRDCQEHLVCISRICSAPLSRVDGNPCDAEGSLCEVGTFCDGAFCRPYSAVGEACAEDQPCGPNAACVDRLCAPLGGVEDPCETDRSCRAGLACFGGRCAAVESCP